MLAPTHLEEHRPALTGHCYRMLGSSAEADDAVQETLLRAWRSREQFEGRSAVRTWLYRIATRVCLDALAERSRRGRPTELFPVGGLDDPLVVPADGGFIEPIADGLAIPADAGPEERAVLRQSIRLAFVAALQHLAPRQRAALLLADVLDWSAREIADCLDTSVPAVNSALQRARATLARRGASPGAAELSAARADLVDRYVDAFERYDVDALAELLHADATLSMPPFTLWLRGPADIRAWLLGRGAGCRGTRLVPVAAGGAPAFGQYKPSGPGGPLSPWSITVLELSGDRIAAWIAHLDTAALFPRFGLPAELPADTPARAAHPRGAASAAP